MNAIPERLADRLYDDVWLPDETIAVRKQTIRQATLIAQISPLSITACMSS